MKLDKKTKERTMETKHTPGPMSLAEVRHGTGFAKGARFYPATPLQDAAPTMLAALRVCLSALYAESVSMEAHEFSYGEAVQAARAAIAAAEGKS